MINFTGCLAYQDAMKHDGEKNQIFAVEWNDSVGSVYKDLKYGDGERFHDYDLYIPADTSTEKAKHLILFVHGGSWLTGDKSSGIHWCKYLTSKGYVTATCNYTLLTDDYHPTILSINDEIGECIQAIKKECTARGINLVSMAMSGFSAGGCQALMRGFKNKDDSALPIKFIINQSGPTTFDPSLWFNQTHWLVKRMNEMEKGLDGWASWLTKLSGKTVTLDMIKAGEDVALWKECSPVSYITEESVPVVLCYGALDAVVPAGSKYVLMEVLEQKKVTYDSYICPNAGHSLSFDFDIQQQFLNKVDEYLEKYF